MLAITIAHLITFSVTWPMNRKEAGDDLVLIQTSPFFSCKYFLW